MSTGNAETAKDEPGTILRQEIIESQKTQADFLKWKLISVASVGAISFGFISDGRQAPGSARLLVCLVPVLCAYVDLISLHIMIRIMTIGIYLRMQGNDYEKFVFEIRSRSSANPFVFEAGALHGSSIFFNTIVIMLGFVLPKGPAAWPQPYLTAYIVAGALGIVWTIALWLLYRLRVKEVIRLAGEVPRSAADVAQSS